MLWPVAVSRTAGTVVAVAIALAAGVRPRRRTRTGLRGHGAGAIALYPGMTVLLARWAFGERMRWLQRAGLLLAAFGVVLLTR